MCAGLAYGTVVGEYHRLNGKNGDAHRERVGQDLNRVSGQLDEAIQRAGVPPRSVKVNVRRAGWPDEANTVKPGRWGYFSQSWSSSPSGSNFQSMKLAFVVWSTIPSRRRLRSDFPFF